MLNNQNCFNMTNKHKNFVILFFFFPLCFFLDGLIQTVCKFFVHSPAPCSYVSFPLLGRSKASVSRKVWRQPKKFFGSYGEEAVNSLPGGARKAPPPLNTLEWKKLR